jgi:hypothetical protein
VGRRNRRRAKLAAQPDDAAAARSGEPGRRAGGLAASEYTDAEAGTLALRGSLTPGSRRDYSETLAGGLNREDARQRATELLFERLAVSWTVSGVKTSTPRELLGRYRMASGPERDFVREALRRHVEENFPDLQAP